MSYTDIASSVNLREGTELEDDVGTDAWYVVVWERFSQNKVAKLSFQFFVFMVFLAIFFPTLTPISAKETQPFYQKEWGGGSRTYTNLRHPFGTGGVGRDILAMILAGSQTSMLVGIGSTIIALSIGVPLGLLSGYYGGRVEEVIMRITDFFLALPFLIIAILTVHLINQKFSFGNSTNVVPIIIMLVIGVLGWGGTTRLVSATTKQTLEQEYVSAARALGASDGRIMVKHILPNVLAPIIVVGTLAVGSGILSEAGLTYLGLGSPTDVSWGNLINSSQEDLILHGSLALIPGFTIFFVVLAINLLGDSLRDALDPRLKE